MNNQWKLVPVEATREILVAMLKADGHVNRYRDAIAAAPAPQQAPKPFMYGIMQPDGAPHYSELCVSGEASDLASEVESMNEGEGTGYRVVGLYTHPDDDEVNRLRAERDALQLRLNAADQRIDELTQHEHEPVNWAAPKTVRQLIRQLQTLDQDLETHAMLRIPDFKDGKQVRSCPLSISYERMEGPWLSSYKGEGRKVIAIWAKPDHRDLQDQGETLTESAES